MLTRHVDVEYSVYRILQKKWSFLSPRGLEVYTYHVIRTDSSEKTKSICSLYLLSRLYNSTVSHLNFLLYSINKQKSIKNIIRYSLFEGRDWIICSCLILRSTKWWLLQDCTKKHLYMLTLSSLSNSTVSCSNYVLHSINKGRA